MDARMSGEPTDLERYPTLTESGGELLRRMVEHPCAPRYRNRSGNRLLSEEVAQLRKFEADTLTAQFDWDQSRRPEWLDAFVAYVHAEVPHYRGNTRPERFEEIPSVSRADLAADIARFVPDDIPVERMINFSTTGTTGHPLLIPSHPLVAGSYLAFHKRALNRGGITLTHGSGQVGVILMGYQQRCFTYVSVTPTMDESGLAKINLHPDEWQHPEDRGRYLDAMAPEVIAGDPISFSELLTVELQHRPRALISVSMALSNGLRTRLIERFGAPVFDIYSMNEAGPIACRFDELGGHLLLQSRLYVEILDRAGHVLQPGERGEVTLTGGFNFCLPLLRYRTGDYGSLKHTSEGPVILGLQGRQPVRFRTATGSFINNIDVAHALGRIPLSRFTCHQCADGAMQVALPSSELHWKEEIRSVLKELLGDIEVGIVTLRANDKVVQYSSDIPGALEA